MNEYRSSLCYRALLACRWQMLYLSINLIFRCEFMRRRISFAVIFFAAPTLLGIFEEFHRLNFLLLIFFSMGSSY